jgi:hypothetical protein
MLCESLEDVGKFKEAAPLEKWKMLVFEFGVVK